MSKTTLLGSIHFEHFRFLNQITHLLSSMSRQADHVLSFVLAEVGSTGSIDGSGRLVIKGKFQPKHIENILRNYIGKRAF